MVCLDLSFINTGKLFTNFPVAGTTGINSDPSAGLKNAPFILTRFNCYALAAVECNFKISVDIATIFGDLL